MDLKALLANIRGLALKTIFWLARSARSHAERKAMIGREHELPLTRQAEVLKLSRSSLYYRARPVSQRALAVMRRIDELRGDVIMGGRSRSAQSRCQQGTKTRHPFC